MTEFEQEFETEELEEFEEVSEKPKMKARFNTEPVHKFAPEVQHKIAHADGTIEFRTSERLLSYKKFEGDNYTHFSLPHAGTYVLIKNRPVRIPDSGSLTKRSKKNEKGELTIEYLSAKLPVLKELKVGFSAEYEASELKNVEAAKDRENGKARNGF